MLTVQFRHTAGWWVVDLLVPMLLQDLLGLQSLNSTGRLHFLTSPTDHLRFTEDWFNTNLMPYIKVDSSQVHLPIAVSAN